MKTAWKWFVLCLCTLLALSHAAYAEEACQHWVLCENPTVCVECGAEGVNVPEGEYVHEWLFTNQGKTHKLYCLYCDYEEAPEEHFAMCNAPDVCLGCGAKGLELSEESIIHDEAYRDLGMQHQYYCIGCGYEDEPENHWAVCDEPTICAGCGFVKIDIPDAEIYHEEKYLILEGQHQVACERCDYTEPATDHTAVCTAPTKCFYCKADIPSVSFADMLHFAANVEMNITATTHENYCTYCGHSWGVNRHQVNCAEPNTCLTCGKTGLITSDFAYCHVGPITGMSITDAGHSFACGQCGLKAENEAHTFDKGFCYICGYEQAPEQPVRVPGDADGDGAVTIMDALAILQYDVGWGTSINTSNADVDANGSVTIMDALLILQYDVGWDIELK